MGRYGGGRGQAGARQLSRRESEKDRNKRIKHTDTTQGTTRKGADTNKSRSSLNLVSISASFKGTTACSTGCSGALIEIDDRTLLSHSVVITELVVAKRKNKTQAQANLLNN